MAKELKKYVVTGGAGFIGSNLVDKLCEKGHTVTIIDDLSTGKEENINAAAYHWKQDLSTVDVDTLAQRMKDVDTVFHFAALARVQPSIENPLPYNEVNVTGTLKLLMAAQKAGVRRVVYSASSSCYGDTDVFPTPENSKTNPLSPYGLQKFIGEQYCKMFSEVYGLDTCSLRYFNVYGNRMNESGAYALVLALWKKQKREGKPLTITNDGNQRRDFTSVVDVVNANLLASEHVGELKGESFNIGNGSNYSINEVAAMIGGPTTFIGERIEPFETLADNTKAKNILGWKPTGDLEKFIGENY